MRAPAENEYIPVTTLAGSSSYNITRPDRQRRKDTDKGLAAAAMLISAGHSPGDKFVPDP